MRSPSSLQFAWLGALAALVTACHAGTSENHASAPSVPVVNTESPATNPAEEESKNEPAPAEVAIGPISTEAPPDVGAPPRDAERNEYGLASKVLKPGTGTVKPTTLDRVVVHYAGWTKDGKLIDSSVERNTPSNFGVNQVIGGWTQGLQLMVVGERRRFWIPAKLAYGEHPPSGAPAGDLTFDIELLEIASTPETPPDVSQAPPDATTTPSGLAYKFLKKGSATAHPTPTSRVTVHYSGWTTNGVIFDSSVARGSPSSFGLDQVIKGWSEGVQLMVVGDKARFWIPADLAYGDSPKRAGAPAGMLVFDIELLDVK